ncbi:MAG: hypothetical protein R3B07_02125 [Polyangiaceae bacterium]
MSGDGRADVRACACPKACAAGKAPTQGFGDAILGPELSDAKGWGKTQYSAPCASPTSTAMVEPTCAPVAKMAWPATPAAGIELRDARILTALSDAAGFDDVTCYGTLRLGDVDGDGKSDVCAREPGMSCWLATDSGFVERIAGPAWSDEAGWSDWHN